MSTGIYKTKFYVDSAEAKSSDSENMHFSIRQQMRRSA